MGFRHYAASLRRLLIRYRDANAIPLDRDSGVSARFARETDVGTAGAKRVAMTAYATRQALRTSHANTETVTYWRGKDETVSEWIAERTEVKARRAAVERQTAADWAHLNALIARAAAESAA